MVAVANFVRRVLENALVKELSLKHLGIDLIAANDADGYTTFPLWCDKAIVTLKIRIPGLSLKGISINAKASLNGKDFGEVTSPFSPSKLKGSILDASIVNGKLKVTDSCLENFIEFSRIIICEKECTINLTGKADVKVDFGSLGNH
ncbi:hypothetical protein BGW38_004532, partial [Lunasporangiospora selenospora]